MRREFATGSAPHLPPRRSVRDIMACVLLALLPGIAAHIMYFGPGLLFQIALASVFALVGEAVMLTCRGRPLRPFLTDLSAPLTAVLFALCLPPLAPWWIALTGMAAGVVCAKHLYGGLGSNLFNPAMVGYALVLICFPLESYWPAAADTWGSALGLTDTAHAIFLGVFPQDSNTLIPTIQNLISGGNADTTPFAGYDGGWLAAGYVLGGLFLLWKRVISWQVPAATLGTAIALGLLLSLFGSDAVFPLQPAFSSSLTLAAFFIATDPVSGCVTPRGQLIFAAGVAVLMLAIRHWGAYPDSIAFAVLLMNCAAPWIDRYTRPRIFGHDRS